MHNKARGGRLQNIKAPKQLASGCYKQACTSRGTANAHTLLPTALQKHGQELAYPHRRKRFQRASSAAAATPSPSECSAAASAGTASLRARAGRR